jgi:hypothetical protein
MHETASFISRQIQYSPRHLTWCTASSQSTNYFLNIYFNIYLPSTVLFSKRSLVLHPLISDKGGIASCWVCGIPVPRRDSLCCRTALTAVIFAFAILGSKMGVPLVWTDFLADEDRLNNRKLYDSFTSWIPNRFNSSFDLYSGSVRSVNWKPGPQVCNTSLRIVFKGMSDCLEINHGLRLPVPPSSKFIM